MNPAPLLLVVALVANPAGMVAVGPGVVKPLYAAPAGQPSDVSVPRFLLDARAVTNGEFLAFVRTHPEWRSDRVVRLFADDGYLAHWASATRLGPSAPATSPVVRVSWFAARAYCAARGARLPTEDEWELAALADETRPDAHSDPIFLERILAWYGRPTPTVLPAAGLAAPNYWGARELHGLIWEWVLDFGNEQLSDGGGASSRFCGGGGEATDADKTDYAAFMRSAFRSALQASYTTGNLGFRCARDFGGTP